MAEQAIILLADDNGTDVTLTKRALKSADLRNPSQSFQPARKSLSISLVRFTRGLPARARSVADPPGSRPAGLVGV
jgi:hypothetical protein